MSSRSPFVLVGRNAQSLIRKRRLSSISYSRFASSSASLPKSSWSPSRVALATVTIGALGFGTYLAWPSPTRRAIVSSSLPLSPFHFTPVTVESSETNPLDPSTKIITLRLPPHLLPTDEVSRASLAAVHSIYVKDDDIQVERPYTPLYGIETDTNEHPGRMVFWIKKYPHGEVGRWLHSKKPEEKIEIRGPVVTWDYAKDMQLHNWDEIVMISGGTGITPFFQLLQARFGPSAHPAKDALQRPHLTLLHGSPSPSTLPPDPIMSTLHEYSRRHRDAFTMKVFVEQDSERDSTLALAPGRITRVAIEEALVQRQLRQPPDSASSSWLVSPIRWLWSTSASGRRTADEQKAKRVLFLVCGPEPMIESLAGPRPKTRADIERTGVLGELGYGATQIRRL